MLRMGRTVLWMQCVECCALWWAARQCCTQLQGMSIQPSTLYGKPAGIIGGHASNPRSRFCTSHPCVIARANRQQGHAASRKHCAQLHATVFAISACSGKGQANTFALALGSCIWAMHQEHLDSPQGRRVALVAAHAAARLLQQHCQPLAVGLRQHLRPGTPPRVTCWKHVCSGRASSSMKVGQAQVRAATLILLDSYAFSDPTLRRQTGDCSVPSAKRTLLQIHMRTISPGLSTVSANAANELRAHPVTA